MSEQRFFDRNGSEMTLWEWAIATGDVAYKRVAVDQIRTGEVIVTISTVWIGIDTSIGGHGLIFETMIFGGRHDQWQQRYVTEVQAIAGHDRTVAWILDGGGRL